MNYFKKSLTSKVLIISVVTALSLIVINVANLNKASAAQHSGAYSTSNPFNTIPAAAITYLVNGCSSGVHTASMISWISAPDNRLSGISPVSYGATSVTAQYNSAVYICDTGMNGAVVGNSRIATNFGVTGSAPPTNLFAPGTIPYFVTHGVGGTDRWHVNDAKFAHLFSAPVTASQTIRFNVYGKGINWRSYSPSFGCLTAAGDPRVYPSSFNAFNECPSTSTAVGDILVSVTPPPTIAPTCSAIGGSYAAGLSTSMTSATITNPNSHTALTISASRARFTPPGSVASQGANSVSASGSTTINANATQFNSPGTHTVGWEIDWSGPGVSGTITCPNVTVNITVEPLICEFNPVSTIELNKPFTSEASVIVRNPNRIPVSVTGASFNIVPGTITPPAGQGISNDTGNPPFPITIPANGSTKTFEPNTALVATAAADYDVSWTITTNIGGTAPTVCASVDIFEIREFPYVRFYGNDVFSGGAIKDSSGNCTALPQPTPPSLNVIANGYFDPSPEQWLNHKGSASELAIFAGGQITKMLPGSQENRSRLAELSFANNNNASGAIGGLQFGGGYSEGTNELCADGFPDTTDFEELRDPGGNEIDNVTISNVSSDYKSVNDLTIGGGGLDDGARTTIVVNGNLRIENDIVYNNTSWTTIDEIPLFRVYVTGNIYIDGNVERLDGQYTAKGRISTCTEAADAIITDPADPDDSAWVADCRNKLTVNGAFISNDINLHRVSGTVADSSAGELSSSTHIAESFVFSPELYLALLSESKKEFELDYDNIISLPPSL